MVFRDCGFLRMGKKQLKVSLKKLKPTKAEIDKMEDELEKANYNANDC